MILAVFAHNILNDFTTALLTEVRIKVRHADSLRVQESLENQRILHGIHFGNMHTICHNGRCTGSTAGSNRNTGFLGISNKIPNDEVVVYIPHTADNINFILQPLQIRCRRIGIALLKAFVAQLTEIFLIVIAFGHRERRQMILMENKFHIASVSNFYCILKSLRTVGEQLLQFFFRFEVEFLCLEFHAVLIIYSLAGLHAQQNILHGGILFTQIVGIVGDNQRQSRFPGKAHNALIHRNLLLDAVILQFQIEMLRSKNIRHLKGIFLGSSVIFFH